MTMKTSGPSALIISAALWMCVAGPLRAAETETDTSDSTAQAESIPDVPVAPKVVKPRVRKIVETLAPRSGKTASRTSGAKRADDSNAGQDDTPSSSIQTSLANANARLQTGDTPANSAMKTMSAPADNMPRRIRPTDPAAAQVDAPAANTNTVTADQVNEVDRMSGDKARTPTLSMAVAQTLYSTSNIDSTWNQTSLIGKIFVAFGGLLTVASAARMFMA